MLKTMKLKNQETLAYREQGTGDQVMILLHGNMTSSQHYDVLLEALPESLHVIAVDMRGFGGSSYLQPINSLKDFSDDIKDLTAQLGLKSYVLVGWSTGGGVAMQHAADYPDKVEKLILIESVGITGYPIFKKDEKGQPIMGDFITTKTEIATDAVQVLPILNAYAKGDKATLKTIWNMLIYNNKQPDEKQYEIYLEDMLTQRNLVDVDYALVHFNISKTHNGISMGTGEVEKILCPTLVFQGDQDLVVPQAMGASIRDNIKNVTYISHPYGHSPLIDDVQMVTKEILTFLK